MSNVWFCSDLHLGHKNIERFRHPLISSNAENTERIFNDWNKHVHKRDIVYVLGDFCFDAALLPACASLQGTKYLVRGNHDEFDLGVYATMFKDIYGIVRYKEFWLTHAPIHPNELRGKVNLHGHVHFHTVDDTRYFNCCPENTWEHFNRTMVSLDEIRQHLVFRRRDDHTQQRTPV